MAGATRDMNLSFQAAETALRATETFIESSIVAPDDVGTAADEPEDPFTNDYWFHSDGELVDDAVEIDVELEGITLPQRYMIKQLEKIGDATVFRVTVRGIGGTNNRATLLRSHYAKVFGADPAEPVRRLSWEQLFPSQ